MEIQRLLGPGGDAHRGYSLGGAVGVHPVLGAVLGGLLFKAQCAPRCAFALIDGLFGEASRCWDVAHHLRLIARLLLESAELGMV